jgi:hypothetical protein
MLCFTFSSFFSPRLSTGTLNSIVAFVSQPIHKVVLDVIKMQSPYYLYPKGMTPPRVKQPPQVCLF